MINKQVVTHCTEDKFTQSISRYILLKTFMCKESHDLLFSGLGLRALKSVKIFEVLK